MARKNDLLSEAIADAKAVKKTAMENAKIALEEAFTPKLQSMISAKLAEEADDEMEEELDSSDLGSGDNAEPSADANDSSDIENDDELMVAEDEEDMDMDSDEEDMDMDYDEEDMDMDSDEEDMDMDSDEEMGDDELDLESVIAELEAEMNDEEDMDMDSDEEEMDMDDDSEMDDEEDIDLDEVIKALREMDDSEEEVSEEEDTDETYKEELEEAYKTIKSLKKTINEVNLLNAKLLYTNKLFRTFDLNENQKVKVLENFDRTSSVREVKLVFSTIAENLNVARKRKAVVKEGYASRATQSSAPKKQIISEGNELVARWKKLAGL